MGQNMRELEYVLRSASTALRFMARQSDKASADVEEIMLIAQSSVAVNI
jgi:hypothetical protein